MLQVYIVRREASCGECGENLGERAWITLNRERGALCLDCADLDHLVYLPAGAAALTRRAGKHSALVAVVLKWARARERYERQGMTLVRESVLAPRFAGIPSRASCCRKGFRRTGCEIGISHQHVNAWED